MAEDPIGFGQGCDVDFLNILVQIKMLQSPPAIRSRKPQQELTIIGENIALEAVMVDPNLRLYPSFGRFSCPSCAYRSPCTMKQSGADYVYTLESMLTS